MAHPLFERQPLLGRLFDIEIASGGDSVTVNVGHYRPGDPYRPFASTHAAGYRAIYDLADLDRSSFVAATGQSGNPLSRHYRDLTDLWARDQVVTINRAAQAYRRGGIGELRLRPRPAQAAS
jgi:penicillin amidase